MSYDYASILKMAECVHMIRMHPLPAKIDKHFSANQGTQLQNGKI
jgi:hypothetical protein